MAAPLAASSNHLYAFPALLGAASVLVAGVWMFRRSRRSPVGVLLFVATLGLDAWLWSIAALLLIPDPNLALMVARAGFVGIPFIPAALFQAVVSISSYPSRQFRLAARVIWVIAAGFVATALLGTRFVTGVTPLGGGFHPGYGGAAAFLLLFFLCVLLASVARLLIEWDRSAIESAERRRMASLFATFAIGCLASVDFLPKFGIWIYPVGYFGILLCLGIMAYVIWRGRPVNITPALAAHEILATMSDPIVVLDQHAVVRLANPAAGAWLGRPAYDLVGRPVSKLLGNSALGDALAAMPSGGKLDRQEFTHLPAPGEARTVNLAATMVRHNDGSPMAVVCVLRDVTETRKLEQQMQQAQKLDAIGQLAGGIAHDLNNILQVVLANTELLRLQQPENGTPLAQVQQAAQRGAWLTRRLLEFARRQILEPVILDLAGTVRDMQPMLQRLVGEHVRVEVVPAEGELLVRADRGQIEQVLLNLVSNSSDAMPRGGRIGLEVFPDPGARNAVLRVSDSGTGMDDATRARIFEPFFTTKGEQGTGLGLSTVYGIVKQNGGQIDVDTHVGVGTTFTVTLPRLDRKRNSGPKGQASHLHTGKETILLVEDDPAVRSSTLRSLTRSGYHVIEAEHGGAALEQAKAYGGPIHLVLTDLSMPGIPVTEMVQTIGVARPDTEFLYMSGFSDDAVVRHGIERTGAGFLQKPFEISDLLAKVRNALDRGEEDEADERMDTGG